MTKHQAVEDLLKLMPVLNFCSRPHLPRSYTAVRNVGGAAAKHSIKKGDVLELDIRHYVTIFLISILNADGAQCGRPELKKLFTWKWPGHESTFEDVVIKRLRALDIIRQHNADYPGTAKVVTFTEQGERVLEELRSERRQQIAAMLSTLELEKESDYERVVGDARKLANSMWQEIRKEAKSHVRDETKSATLRTYKSTDRHIKTLIPTGHTSCTYHNLDSPRFFHSSNLYQQIRRGLLNR